MKGLNRSWHARAVEDPVAPGRHPLLLGRVIVVRAAVVLVGRAAEGREKCRYISLERREIRAD